MPDVVAPVPVADIVVPRGASRIVRFFVSRNGVNVVLSTPGTQLIFTARLRLDGAATPLLQKSYVAPGTTPHLSPDPGGIAATEIDTNNDSTPDTWVADMTLGPADTETIEESLLRYDLWLLDASSESPVLQGTLKLSPTVFRP